MPNIVKDDGSLDAKLVLIGEAPGRHEDRIGKPFVGPAGMKLDDWWAGVGLSRSDFYITNVVPYFPGPGDGAIEKIPKAEIQHWADELHQRLAALHDPWLIVPTGNKALHALTGQGKMYANERKPGITAHRGSIYEYVDANGRRIKTIPTIHPAATFRTSTWGKRCRLDWARIASDSAFRELRLPQRTHHTRPDDHDVAEFVYQ